MLQVEPSSQKYRDARPLCREAGGAGSSGTPDKKELERRQELRGPDVLPSIARFNLILRFGLSCACQQTCKSRVTRCRCSMLGSGARAPIDELADTTVQPRLCAEDFRVSAGISAR